nr:retrovirus-related Pol polyprotein from transposon TNT 1-94 [Tanacetum cinerariifolium]
MDSDKYLEGQSMQRPPLFESESIDSAFVRFNTIITSLKALDEGFSSKNYVKKFLRALHPKWRVKLTVIEESKDLTSLSLYELIGNLKVHEMIIKKDSKIVKAKGERRSLSLKTKKEYSDAECSTSGKCPKPPKEKSQRTFVGSSWSDSGEEDDETTKDETCLVAQASNEVKYVIVACALDFKLFQQDIKSAFLNGFINEEVYVAQPPGFIDNEKSNHVYKLKKALYGLKQAPKGLEITCSCYHGFIDKDLINLVLPDVR